MPDQFTLSRFQDWERAREDRKPVMAEIALLSSHAPWTPVPTLIDWSTVDDGSIFNAQASSGDAADVVWQDRARVMRHFRESAEYVVQTLMSYVAEFGDDDLVLLILGDHQPMPFVTDNTDNRDVMVGASPRAGIALMNISKAFAFMRGRNFVTPDDVKEIAPAVLRHRVSLRPEAEIEGQTADDVIKRLLDSVAVPR
jgi:hypothetical protein